MKCESCTERHGQDCDEPSSCRDVEEMRAEIARLAYANKSFLEEEAANHAEIGRLYALVAELRIRGQG